MGPMEQMQKYFEEYPHWKDQVTLLTLSIDDQEETARCFLKKKRYHTTENTWGGSGGWQSATAKAFRVNAIPHAFILDSQGRILFSGSPHGIPHHVDRLLQ